MQTTKQQVIEAEASRTPDGVAVMVRSAEVEAAVKASASGTFPVQWLNRRAYRGTINVSGSLARSIETPAMFVNGRPNLSLLRLVGVGEGVTVVFNEPRTEGEIEEYMKALVTVGEAVARLNATTIRTSVTSEKN
jgi:arginine exporter protein ArgO